MSAESGRLVGSVALITGGSTRQDRAHAVRLAEEGADVVVLDHCAPIASAPTRCRTPRTSNRPSSSSRDSARRALAVQADVRDLGALQGAVPDIVATARFVTGVALPVDGGMRAPVRIQHAAG